MQTPAGCFRVATRLARLERQSFRQQRYPIGATHPKVGVPVLEDGENGVARQPVRREEVGHLAVAETKQSVVARAKPQAAVRDLVNRPDLRLRHRSGGRALNEDSAVQMAQPAIRADPHAAIAELDNCTDEVVR